MISSVSRKYQLFTNTIIHMKQGYKKTHVCQVRAHPCLLVETALGLVQLGLQGSPGLGQGGIAAVQILDLPHQLKVLLSQTGLQTVEVGVGAGQVIHLDL